MVDGKKSNDIKRKFIECRNIVNLCLYWAVNPVGKLHSITHHNNLLCLAQNNPRDTQINERGFRIR